MLFMDVFYFDDLLKIGLNSLEFLIYSLQALLDFFYISIIGDFFHIFQNSSNKKPERSHGFFLIVSFYPFQKKIKTNNKSDHGASRDFAIFDVIVKLSFDLYITYVKEIIFGFPAFSHPR